MNRRRVVIHYGRGPWQSSCGMTRDATRMTTDRQQVTCWSCRGTLQWRTHFHEGKWVPTVRSWDVLTYHPGRGTLPPDLTPALLPPGEECGQVWHNFICTRMKRHTGRHAAGDGQVIVAVWPQEGED